MEQTIRQLVTWLSMILPALMLLGAACIAALVSIALGTLQDWLTQRAPPRIGARNPNCRRR